MSESGGPFLSPGTTKFCSLSQETLRISRYKTDKNVSCFRCSFPWAFCWVCEGRERYRGIQGGRTPLSGDKPVRLGVERAMELCFFQCGSWGVSQSPTWGEWEAGERGGKALVKKAKSWASHTGAFTYLGQVRLFL